MPFVIRRKGSQFCVHKRNEDGSVGRSMGCHDSEEGARNQQRALYAAEGRGELGADDLVVLEDDGDNRGFQAVLTLEGTPTSDGRYFPPNSLTWRTLPIPLMWQRTEPEGGLGGNPHGGSVLVGKITEIERRGDEIWGFGIFDTSEDAVEAQRLVTEQLARWVSVDVVSGDIQLDEEARRMTINDGVIGAATIVAIPAFAQAVIAPADAEIPVAATDLGREPAVTADGADNSTAPITILIGNTASDSVTAGIELAWDGSPSRFSDTEYRRASAMCDGGDAPTKSQCHLPHHDPGGALNRRGLIAAAGRFNQTSSPRKETGRRHLVGHYREQGMDIPPNLKAHVAPLAPPAAWFADPVFGEVGEDPRLAKQRDGTYACPLTVTADGFVFGHLYANRGQCHIGIPGECVTPPASAYDYAYALRGTRLCAEGTKIRTGTITMGCGHAPHGISSAAAIAHYDGGPGAVQVADVALGEDRYATWYAGALRPDLTDEQVLAFRAMGQVSGDWRRMGDSLELVAILAVPVPGYPVLSLAASGECEDCAPSPYATSAHLEDGEVTSLVAAAVVARPDPMALLADRVAALEEWRAEQERTVLKSKIGLVK